MKTDFKALIALFTHTQFSKLGIKYVKLILNVEISINSKFTKHVSKCRSEKKKVIADIFKSTIIKKKTTNRKIKSLIKNHYF